MCRVVLLMRGAFQTSKIFETFNANKFWNFQGKFPETQKIVEFQKCEPLNGNSEKMGKWNAYFRKIRKISENVVLFHAGNFRKFKPEYLVVWKAIPAVIFNLDVATKTLCSVKQLILTLVKGFCLTSLDREQRSSIGSRLLPKDILDRVLLWGRASVVACTWTGTALWGLCK